MVPDLPSSPISPGPGTAHFINFSRPMSKPAGVPFDSRSNASSTRSSKKGAEDPLSRALAPPPDETPEERAQRIRAEERAKKVSEDIDKYLKKDGEDTAKKMSATVRLLLLGQSESGKSTALKNFQLLYNPQSFQAERLAWRLVILFNLVHSIRVLHHIVQDALDKQQQHQEEADSRDVSLGKSPTSPLFTRAPLPDFHDLLPPMPDPRQLQQQKRQHHSLSLSVNINHNPGSPPISPVGGDLDPDLTDAASSHSAGSTSNAAAKQSVNRRSSFFSTAKLDKKRSPERKRPATSTGISPIATNAPISAFNLPIISPPTTKLRVGALSDDDYKRPDLSTLRKTRSRDSLSGRKATIKANNLNLLSAGLESSASLASIREFKPNGQSLPQLQSFPDLKWNAQHRLLLMRIKPLLTIEADLLRRLSVPDEDEAVRLDFNLPEMHKTAVRVAIMGRSPTRDRDEAGTDDHGNATKRQSNKENGAAASRFGRSISSGGRPRARSSVDIDTAKSAGAADGKAKSLASESTSTLSTEDPALSPLLVDRRKSDDIINRMKGNATSNSNGAVAFGNGNGSSGNSTRARVFVPSGDGVVIPEFFVRSTTNWKEKLRKLSKYDPTGQFTKGKGDDAWEWNPWDDEMDPAHFVQACAHDILALWDDPVVQEHLARNNFKMEHSPGFFLRDVERITSRDYIPTDDDILRARIKTIGVTEHKLSVDSRSSVPKEWLVYDVGGSRTQRAAWLPYFDTTDAIIFIASLSSFDQVLTEDPTVNRMEDSLRLFRTIVNSPILKDVNIILLLNKIDILDAKIQAGIQVGQHFKRYGDRPNTTEAVTKYFRTKFGAIFEKFTPPNSKRLLSIHTTSLTNPKSTRLILEAVSETIIKAHMRNQGVV